MSSTPGWVNVLAQGVPGVVAAFDFVNQLYWQQGNPSGGLTGSIPLDPGGNGLILSSNQLFLQGSFLQTKFPGSILVKFSGVTNDTNGIVIGCGLTNDPFIVNGASTVGIKNVTTLTATLGSGSATGTVVAACGFDLTGRSLVVNGGVLVKDTVAQTYTAGLFFGNFEGINSCGGFMQSAVFWPSRLPDATLQSLT